MHSGFVAMFLAKLACTVPGKEQKQCSVAEKIWHDTSYGSQTVWYIYLWAQWLRKDSPPANAAVGAWPLISLNLGMVVPGSTKKKQKSKQLWHTQENSGSKCHMSSNVLCPALVNAWVHHCSLCDHEFVSVDSNAWRWYYDFTILCPRNRRRRPTRHIAWQLNSVSLHGDLVVHRLQHSGRNCNSTTGPHQQNQHSQALTADFTFHVNNVILANITECTAKHYCLNWDCVSSWRRADFTYLTSMVTTVFLEIKP